MAELVQRCSKHDVTGVDLDRLLSTLEKAACRPHLVECREVRRHKLEHRVSPGMAAQLVADYEAGVPTTKLVGSYGIGKSSVLRLLQEAGVSMRRQPLSPDQVAQAEALYRSGLSVTEVAVRLDLNPSTVWRTFQRRGVSMRAAGRPSRRSQD